MKTPYTLRVSDESFDVNVSLANHAPVEESSLAEAPVEVNRESDDGAEFYVLPNASERGKDLLL